MNAFGRVFDILIFCVAGFLVPVVAVVCLTERVAITSAGVAVQKFSENVSTKGYVNLQMYENYKKQLDSTGILFYSDMEIEHEALAPEYEMRSIEDAEDYLNGLWSGTNELHQGTVTTSLPSVTDPGVPLAGTITSTESIQTTTSGPSASHVHTAACYLGHNHAALGCGLHVHTDACRCTGEFWYQYDTSHCCGSMRVVEYKPGTNYARGQCTHCGWSEWTYVGGGDWYHWTYPVYVCDTCGYKNNCNSEYVSRGDQCLKIVCGKEGQYACGYTSIDTTPDCGLVVTSIVPISSKQALFYGQTPDVRAKVTFADGHSEIVNATISGFNATQCNTVQTVTLSYGTYAGSLSNVRPSTCTVKLTVRYPFEACEYGHMYYRVDGVNTLCPYCYAYPKTIQVLGVDSAPFYITKGKSLQDSGMYLGLIYYDGHARVITSGWTDNLDKNYVGLQTVTIGYLGASTTLLVYNERVKVPCPVCGYEYYLYPDNTDPGCPKCLAAIPVFTGNVLRYRETVSYGEILEELYHGEGIYRFSRGDRLEIEVWKTGETGLSNVLERIFHKDIGEELVGMYGVRIRDEIQEKR